MKEEKDLVEMRSQFLSFFFGRSFVVVLSHLQISARGSMMRIKKEKQLKPQPQLSNNNNSSYNKMYVLRLMK
jgi:hypothetical protein